jgi:hypothetical protein
MLQDGDEGPLPEVQGLVREISPPPDLENRIVGELNRRGYLKRKRTNMMTLFAVAASMATFAVGYTLGSRNEAVMDSTREYALLLYAGPDFVQAPADDPDRHVRTYSAWGTDLARRGLLTDAGELGADSWLLREDGSTTDFSSARGAQPEGELTGFFLVRSRDATQALEIARTHPHLRNRGTIALREIVTGQTPAR